MKTKFIWDFRGYDALETARHHAIHLAEFSEKHSLDEEMSGHKPITEMYATTYMILPENEVEKVRAALRPHREEYC